MKALWEYFKRSPSIIQLAISTVASMWIIAVVALVTGCAILLERPVEAGPRTPGVSTPVIGLNPTTGPLNTSVTVYGQGWAANSNILLYLEAPGEIGSSGYALSGTVADTAGQFTASLVIPADTRWEAPGLIRVVARSAEGGASAEAFFGLIGNPEQPTETPMAQLEPTATPALVEPTATPTPVVQPPTATPQPGYPLVTATTDVNIRSGPGTGYAILGALRTGQSAEVTGLSPDNGWWQIKFAGVPEGRGWLSARYVIAQNTQNVIVVQPPAVPATPTALPTPTPLPTATPTAVVITDWRGEYYNNPSLSGNPVLVRNDPGINFNWGAGSPGPGVPADNFSVRWTRNQSFSAGDYRFSVLVDDGARLWVNGNLVINEWRDSPPTTYTAEVNLAEGMHSLRLEYYEFRYDAQVSLKWERLDNYPDWKAEYFNNRNLEGQPVLVRNESKIDHNWGSGSPGSGVAADKFSARWTRQADFEAGRYRFQVTVDDGMRLRLDNELLIDDWRDSSARTIEVERQVSGGRHQLKVEYYERTGDARIKVSWQKVGNQPPQPDPGGPYTVDENSLVMFDGSRSQDPDGVIISYEWDFDYKGDVFRPDASGPTASTRYPDGPATFIIALRVTDDKGASGVGTTSVTIRNVAPTVEAGGPYVGQVGSPITLAGTATDPGAADQLGLSYQWDFGDGATGNGPVVSHSYREAKIYTVRLTVTDKDGAQGSDTATVEISEPTQRPEAVIIGPTKAIVGETLNFSGSGSSEPDPSIVSYAWDFGDGTTGSGVNVAHTYSRPDGYTVILTVTNKHGLSASARHSIIIEAPLLQPPTAHISAPENAEVNQSVTFDGSGSRDPDGNLVSYAWDFGDGSAGSGVGLTHSYVATGTYTITLTVTDDSGLRAQATHAIIIALTPAPQPSTASEAP